jgi:hypothetical protein
MTGLLLTVAVVLALAGAARSTWSPCALSMMSTITPFGEKGRGHRYGATAAWFVAGSIAGGLTSGAVAAGLAALWSVTRLAAHPQVAGLIAALAALVGAAVDSGALGPILPLVRRQVDDRWVVRYRPWVYGSGFGWQIGTGLTTYLMTTAVPVCLISAVLTGSPAAALCVGGLFGLARGSTVLTTSGASSPNRLRALHARLDRLGPAVRASTAAALGTSGGVLVGASLTAASRPSHGAVAMVVPAVLGAVTGLASLLAARRHDGSCELAAPADDPAPMRAGRAAPR